MSRHTEGPWAFVTVDGCRKIIGGGKTLMCDTTYYPWCPDADEDWQAMAAVPELLAAAKLARHILTSYEINRINGEEIAAAALQTINAAIAKAEPPCKVCQGVGYVYSQVGEPPSECEACIKDGP